MVNRQVFSRRQALSAMSGTAVNSKKSLEARVRFQGIHIGWKGTKGRGKSQGEVGDIGDGEVCNRGRDFWLNGWPV